MKIETIKLNAIGSMRCRSSFYSSEDYFLGNTDRIFNVGVNRLYGEIDSGIWACSYLLSMYNRRKCDFALYNEPTVIVNNSYVPLEEICKCSCYMDVINPIFSKKHSVRKQVETLIKKHSLQYTADDIMEIFNISPDRYNRPILHLGNETFKAMAAVGYCSKKQIICFPWMSKQRFEYYHGNLLDLIDTLEELEMVTILPVGE